MSENNSLAGSPMNGRNRWFMKQSALELIRQEELRCDKRSGLDEEVMGRNPGVSTLSRTARDARYGFEQRPQVKRETMTAELEEASGQPIVRMLKEALSLIETADSLASAGGDNDDEQWSVVHGLVFSEFVSRRLELVLRDLGISLDYYDPDTSYQEDVVAYVSALNELAPRLQKVLGRVEVQ